MVLTLANVLQMPITAFTSVPNMPLLCIIPSTQTMLTTQPIMLVYTHTGPGHYDSAIPIDNYSPAAPGPARCTCGRKPKNTHAPCSSLRCPCIRERKECSAHCICKVAAINMVLEHPHQSQDDIHPMMLKGNRLKGHQAVCSCNIQVNQHLLEASLYWRCCC